MSRVPPLDPAALTDEQQRVAALIAGARKNVRGPFTIWLRNPTLAEHANAFGVALRDSKVLDRRLFELAAGVSPDVIAAIRDHRRPDFTREDERVVYDVAAELMDTKELSQATYDRAIGQFGLEGTVDLVSTVGYYAMVGIFLKSFNVPAPSGDRPLK